METGFTAVMHSHMGGHRYFAENLADAQDQCNRYMIAVPCSATITEYEKLPGGIIPAGCVHEWYRDNINVAWEQLQ